MASSFRFFNHFVGTSLTNLQFFVNFVNRTVFAVCRLSKYVWVCVIKFLSVVLHVRLRIYGSQNFSSSESSLGSHSTNWNKTGKKGELGMRWTTCWGSRLRAPCFQWEKENRTAVRAGFLEHFSNRLPTDDNHEDGGKFSLLWMFLFSAN